MQKAIKYMRYGAESSRYITIGCLEKSLHMMCCWAEDPNGDEFKYHLARVQDNLWLAEDGMKMQSFGSQIWDCALATQALIASNMVDEYDDSLKKAHFYIKESQKIQLGISRVCIGTLLKDRRLSLIKTNVGWFRIAQRNHLSVYFYFLKCLMKLLKKKLMSSDCMML